MKENLYAVGGRANDRSYILSSCERFDLKENRWFNCPHELPSPLVYPSVIVSEDESFALITGGCYNEIIQSPDSAYMRKCHTSDAIIIFTEKDGFKYLSTSKLISKIKLLSFHKSLSTRVSLILKR